MTTDALLKSVLTFPMMPEIVLLGQTYPNGLENLKTNFPAFISFLNRSDAPSVLKEFYQKRRMTMIDSLQTDFSKGEFLFITRFLETTLVRQELIDKMTTDQISSLKIVLVNAYRDKGQSSAFSPKDYSTNAWSIAKLSDGSNSIAGNDLTAFLKYGFEIDRKTSDLIVDYAVGNSSK